MPEARHALWMPWSLFVYHNFPSNCDNEMEKFRVSPLLQESVSIPRHCNNSPLASLSSAWAPWSSRRAAWLSTRSPTWCLGFLSKLSWLSSTTLSVPFGHPEVRVFAPTPPPSDKHLKLQLVKFSTSTSPATSSTSSFSFLSVAGPLHNCLSCHTAATKSLDQWERSGRNPPMGDSAPSTMHLVSTSPRLQKIQQSQKYKNTSIQTFHEPSTNTMHLYYWSACRRQRSYNGEEDNVLQYTNISNRVCQYR